MRACRGFVTVLVSALALVDHTSAVAQDTAAEPFGDSVDVTLVELSVVVVDRQGRPVPGLNRDDFAVEEDGEEVTIVAVEAAASEPVPAGQEIEEAGIPLPTTEPDLLHWSVFVDRVHSGPGELRRTLESLSATLAARAKRGDLVSVVAYDRNLDVVLPPVRDPERVRSVLTEVAVAAGGVGPDRQWDQAVREMRDQVSMQGCQNAGLAAGTARATAAAWRHEADALLRALGEFVNSLGGVAGENVLLYVGRGAPVRPGESLFQLLGDWCPDQRLELEGFEGHLADVVGRLGSLAAQRGVRVVSVETGGLRGVARHGASAESPTGSAHGGSLVSLVRRENARSPATSLATDSGGWTVFDANDPGAVVAGIAGSLSQRYRITYRADRRADTDPHEVEVRVLRPGVTVRSRRLHRDRTPAVRLADRTLATLWYDLEFDPLGAGVEVDTPRRLDGGNDLLEVQATLTVPLSRLSLIADDGYLSGRLEVFVAVEDSRGRKSAPTRVPVEIRVPEERRLTRDLYEIPFRFVVRPGAYELAVSLVDILGPGQAFLRREIEVTLPPD